MPLIALIDTHGVEDEIVVPRRAVAHNLKRNWFPDAPAPVHRAIDELQRRIDGCAVSDVAEIGGEVHRQVCDLLAIRIESRGAAE